MDFQGFLNNCRTDLAEYWNDFTDGLVRYSTEFIHDPLGFINNNGLVFIGALFFIIFFVVLVINIIRNIKEKNAEREKIRKALAEAKEAEEKSKAEIPEPVKEEEPVKETVPEPVKNETAVPEPVKAEEVPETKEEPSEPAKEEVKEPVIPVIPLREVEEVKPEPEKEEAVSEPVKDEVAVPEPVKAEPEPEIREEIKVEPVEEVKTVAEPAVRQDVEMVPKSVILDLQRQIDAISAAISGKADKVETKVEEVKVEVKPLNIPKFGIHNMDTTRSGRKYTEEEIESIIRD